MAPVEGPVVVERFNATWRRVEPPEVYSTLPGEPKGLREALEEGRAPEKVTVACPGNCSAMPIRAEYAVFTGEEGRWDASADGYLASAFIVPLEDRNRVAYGAITGYAVYRGVALRLSGCNATHCNYTVTGTFTRMMTVEYVDVGLGELKVPPPAGYTCLNEKAVPAGSSTIIYCGYAVKGPFYTIITSWLAPTISATSVAAAYAALRLYCRRSRAASTSSSTLAATRPGGPVASTMVRRPASTMAR